MNDTARSSAGEGIAPDAAALIDDYFDRFTRATLVAGTDVGPDAVGDLVAHVRDRLHGTARTVDDTKRVLRELGEPEALATAFAAVAAEDHSDADADAMPGRTRSTTLTGRILGIPYDVRPPTSERYASRLWNPTDHRVFVPKGLGMGWTINFGALAVRTGLVRPDDEDAPFAAVPPRTLTATLAFPLVVVAAFVVLAAAKWPDLGASLPVHWNAFGDPDGYASRGIAVAVPAAMAVVPLALAGWVHARRHPAFNRVAASAASLSCAILALSILIPTVFTVPGGAGIVVWPGIACMVVLPLLLLVSVSRVGRAAEQRRDLA
jgi:Protein of unknown function (DUF1648)/Family of unknown function (DUF5808)